MIRSRSLHVAAIHMLLNLVVLLGAGDLEGSAERTAKKGLSRVWVVMFYSEGCAHCESVDGLVKRVATDYPVRVKKFNIDEPRGYDLFTSLEAIHGERRFAVPMVILGDDILIGEAAVAEEFEKTVKKLARSGGAPLPYLGPGQPRPKKEAGQAQSGPSRSQPCADCERRPPSIGEEWAKIKEFLGKK
jgi:thiol-disulfide isomerase/thioredoxin